MLLSNNITINQTRDVQLIDSVISALLPSITTDQFPNFMSAKEIMARPDTKAIAVYDEDKLAGAVLLTGCEVHTLFLPTLRGSKAVRAGKQVIQFIKNRFGLKRLSSYAYSNRPEVLFFARLCGFVPDGNPFNDGTTINGVPALRTNLVLEKL